MGFPVSPSTGDEYTAPSGAVYAYTSYGTWQLAEGQTDFSVLSPTDATNIASAISYTAANVLTKLLTVDGTGSTLDADLLDGQSTAYYIDIAARQGFTSFNAAHLPTGTKMLFQQTSAPTGWTKDTTHNDKALRVVSGTVGSGGSTAFTSVFAARTIAQQNLPNVTLSLTTTTDGAHIHTVAATTASDTGTSGGGTRVTGLPNGGGSADTSSNGAHSHSGTTSSINSGVTQTAIDFAVQYVDVVVCTKS